MFSHITIGTNDLAKTAQFYDAFFAPLGITRCFEQDRYVAWHREGEGGHFYICTPFDGASAGAGNGSMSAFWAPSREAVQQAYDAALAHGGSDAGPPGPRPNYSPDYYGAYVRDPDGNKLHVVLRIT